MGAWVVARTARSLLLVKLLKIEPDDEAGASVLNSIPLGSYRQVVGLLAAFNTGPDGSRSAESAGILYGPGLIVQMPMVGPDEPVMQAGVSLLEEDMAFPVLLRICRGLGWKLMDPSSGRTFGGGGEGSS